MRMSSHVSRLVIVSAAVLVFAPVAAFADEPVLSGARDMTVSATSSAGTYVTYSVTAADTDSTPLMPSCTPASGSLFVLGTTTVTCTATSIVNAASSTTAHFDIGVADETAPVITPPANQSFATSTIPSHPTVLPATASDSVDPHPVVTYAPSSFPLGTSTVTWTAKDASGNTSATTSLVTIRFVLAATVDVPSTCIATDTDSVAHTYAASSSTAYLGICALQAAIENGDVSDAQLSNQYPTEGLFVTSIGGITADPASQYWALYQNGEFASSGLTQMTVSAGDTIMFQLHDFSENDLGAQVSLTINSLISTSSAPSSNPVSSSGGGGGISHAMLNMASALAFLSAHQNADGSFGSGDSSRITDWTALAFAASDPGIAKTRLRAYLASAKPAMSSVTDYERHAMALESMGIDPYSGTGVDYISPIVAAYDGTQVGDPASDNDDIFSIYALMQAGYAPSDPMINSIVGSIFSQQKPDGSWDESPDMTAAAMQAVGPFYTFPKYDAAMGSAVGYLLSKQQPNGSWGTSGATNIDSTSWVQTAINSIPPSDGISWASSLGYLPNDAIAGAQQSDGGVRLVSDTSDNRVWSTSYAVSAASGKSWQAVLQSFARPVTGGGGGGSPSQSSSATSSAATSTVPTATSTAAAASSTTPIAATTSEPIGIAKPVPTLFNVQPATSSPAVNHPIRKRRVPAARPPAPTSSATSSAVSQSQAAAAASAPGTSFFGSLWHAITSFFGSIF